MREFQARKHQHAMIARVIRSRWFLAVLIIAVFFIVRGTIRVYKNYTIAREDLQKVKSDIEVLEKRNAELDTQLGHLETEEGQDYEIRRKLDVVKPGERVIQVIDTPENTH